MKNPPPNPLVVALAYDGLCTFEFGVAVEIFGWRARNWGRTGTGSQWRRWMKASCVPQAVSG
ncbi:transcriptional activator FtrA [Atlantibacter hermannii]|nr:transcriptional activator FtrA [Atlantibacter hermannii]